MPHPDAPLLPPLVSGVVGWVTFLAPVLPCDRDWSSSCSRLVKIIVALSV